MGVRKNLVFHKKCLSFRLTRRTRPLSNTHTHTHTFSVSIPPPPPLPPAPSPQYSNIFSFYFCPPPPATSPLSNTHTKYLYIFSFYFCPTPPPPPPPAPSPTHTPNTHTFSISISAPPLPRHPPTLQHTHPILIHFQFLFLSGLRKTECPFLNQSLEFVIFFNCCLNLSASLFFGFMVLLFSSFW